jgi:hypothetical protein
VKSLKVAYSIGAFLYHAGHLLNIAECIRFVLLSAVKDLRPPVYGVDTVFSCMPIYSRWSSCILLPLCCPS